MRGAFTTDQVAQLLQPIKPNRVLSLQGHSHVSQQDITAHLIRMFGFGNFDIEVREVELIFEQERTNNEGKGTGRFDVAYRALVRLTIRNPHGETVAVYENGSTATGQNQTRGDGHDLAYKSAISLSIKRAAIALGDQFGLSLYNKGQTAPLVIATLVDGPKHDGDVQDEIPQQVSLGNDEIDREPDAPRRPLTAKQKVQKVLAGLEACSDADEFQRIRDYAEKEGIHGIPEVQAALAEKHAIFDDPTVDHWAPVAEVKP